VRRRFDNIEFLEVENHWMQGTNMVAREICLFYEDLFSSKASDFLNDMDRLI